jgi:hypothetical protein
LPTNTTFILWPLGSRMGLEYTPSMSVGAILRFVSSRVSLLIASSTFSPRETVPPSES